MPSTIEATACIICGKPLGQETRDAKVMLCHTCRNCKKCGLPLTNQQVHGVWNTCFDTPEFENLDKHVLHPRCESLTRPTGDANPSVLADPQYIEWLNKARLENPYEKMCSPNMALSQETNEAQAGIECEIHLKSLTLEQSFILLARMESMVAHIAIALKKDKKEIKRVLDNREAKKFQDAAAQARVSSRAANVPATDEKEIILGKFMADNELHERKHAVKLLKMRNDAVMALVGLGIDMKTATEQVDADMRKRGQIK